MTVPSRAVTPALLQIDAVLSRLAGRNALAEVCRFLRSSFRHYGWVGVYRLEGATLVLEAWDGEQATEHTRISVERGVCGRAAREGRTVIVDDVRSDPEYLACFLETRAEIVVPVRRDGRILGEIDIDGTAVAAYDASDQGFLETVAARISGALEAAASEPRVA
ncbi:MAG: GAF domain-containing protein [Thermoplasmata archaeon]|jgi:GAF domain-containing protein